MAEASIPVDLLNPGQVFACLGIAESADVLLENAEGGFDWTNESDIRFRLRADGDLNPVATVLDFLAGCHVSTVSPDCKKLSTDKWRIDTLQLQDEEPFPYPAPNSPATLPAVLTHETTGVSITIDYWADGTKYTSRDNVKFWAGAAGYPGAGLARDAVRSIRGLFSEAVSDPFSVEAEQSSSFRLDWRRDYIPIEIGFSINNHARGRYGGSGPPIVMIGYPLVELLGAIGLQHARPARISKLDYRYGVIGMPAGGTLFPLSFLRAALGVSDLPFSGRVFRMNLGWPGKEGQARCVTTVYEETTNV